jgi:MarR family 2-MHQ and catechol resistance regulon transcriptional repressor
MKTTKRYGTRADLALNLWVKLARAHSTFARQTSRDIEQYGLTPPQFSVLETLGHLGPLTMGELGKKILVTGGCVTVIIDNLEKEKLVERVRNTDDRRIIWVQLTDKGEKLFQHIFEQHAARVTELASVLSASEQEALAALLKKLGLAIQELEPNPEVQHVH